MLQLVAALITVRGLFFLSDVHGLFDPSGKTLRLSVDHRRLRPVESTYLLYCTLLLCLDVGYLCARGRVSCRMLNAFINNLSALIVHFLVSLVTDPSQFALTANLVMAQSEHLCADVMCS